MFPKIPGTSLPVTKVKTPFMKAFDWQAAYSSSPWNLGAGEVLMAQFSFLLPSCFSFQYDLASARETGDWIYSTLP